jgi:tetratricopeptide (TPR) repeat protein
MLPAAELNDGARLARAGRLEDALVHFAGAAEADPGSAVAQFELAIVLTLLGRHPEALPCYQKAVRLRPGHAEAHFRLGVALGLADRDEEALASFERALALRPGHAESHFNRGLVLARLLRAEEAMQSFERASAARPDFPDAHWHCAMQLQRLGSLEPALERYDKALTVDPRSVPALAGSAVALGHLGRYREALERLERASALEPGNAEIHIDRGNALRGMQRYPDALRCYEQALTLEPGASRARWNQGLTLLLLGEFDAGWPLYESRFEVPGLSARRRDCALPLWRGEPLRGKSILLTAEQGYGDTIQFCRFLGLIRDAGAEVALEAPERLTALLSSLGSDYRIVAAGDTEAALDFHCPLGSLPGLLGIRAETLPACVPYLRASGPLVQHWRERLEPIRGFRVGIGWQGNPAPEQTWARGRSIPLEMFGALAEIPGVRLISLQKGPGTEQLAAVEFRERVVSFGDELDGGRDAFVDSAAAIANLDLVVTSDTSIAHLAGALGAPVWIALQAVPDWRWLLERADSPWYPTARLYRQPRPGNWAAVFERIVADLRSLLPSGQPSTGPRAILS